VAVGTSNMLEAVSERLGCEEFSSISLTMVVHICGTSSGIAGHCTSRVQFVHSPSVYREKREMSCSRSEEFGGWVGLKSK